jgi:hypothetical protein
VQFETSILADSGEDALTESVTLGELPLGAKLVVRCKKDWRDATVIGAYEGNTILCIGSPSGRTYRLRRPSEAILALDGFIPVLGEGSWRPGLVKYDHRW